MKKVKTQANKEKPKNADGNQTIPSNEADTEACVNHSKPSSIRDTSPNGFDMPALSVDDITPVEILDGLPTPDDDFREATGHGLDDEQGLRVIYDDEAGFVEESFGSTFLSKTALESIKKVYQCRWSDKKPVVYESDEPFRPSRNLLRRYYGLPIGPPLRMLSDHSTILVEHYFREICGVFSSFDSQLNPFRVTIGRIWDSTPSIFYAIQSMAAAQLANTYPKMSVTGLEMQRKAYHCLTEELRLVDMGMAKRERILLAVMLLGLSACWHDSSDLGLTHLAAARSLIVPKLIECGAHDDRTTRRQNQFFEEALIYWEMLMGFVSQGCFERGPERDFDTESELCQADTVDVRSSESQQVEAKLVPHPWTGIAPKIHLLFAEVGRLIRRERLKIRSPLFLSAQQIAWDRDLIFAAKLEEELLSFNLPNVEDLMDFGDVNTSKEDFLILAEAYRCAGLLEIYRVFPTILCQRLGKDEGDISDCSTTLRSFLDLNESSSTGPSNPALWLNSLALHIIRALESLTPKSGTSCLQPILLVVAGSELRFVPSLDFFDFYANDAKIIQARCFVETRFREFALRLPAKPLRKMLDLVKEVWRRVDVSDGMETADIFWIDVMIENGWETVMG